MWGLEPTIGDGCSEETIASRLDISGSEDSWLHNSHQFKTNMNIIFFKKALQGFQTSQICDTQAYVHHLISLRSKRFQSSYCAKVRAEAKKKVEPREETLATQAITWSPVPTRRASVLETQDSFVSLVMQSNNRNDVCDASLPRPRLFLWEKHWGREVRVASQRSCDGKERSCVFHIF